MNPTPPPSPADPVGTTRRATLQHLASLFTAVTSLQACGGGGSAAAAPASAEGSSAGGAPASATATPAPAPVTSAPAPAAPAPSPSASAPTPVTSPAPPPGGSTTPPAAPVPAPNPPPPVAAVDFDVALQQRILDLSRLVLFKDYLDGSPYERFQRLSVLTGTRAAITIKGWTLNNGGVARAFSSARYRLMVDGLERASVTVPAGAVKADFQLDLAPLAEGWHWLDIIGDAGESTPQWVAYVQKGAAPVAQTRMPVVQGSYELINSKSSTHKFGFVPARFTPTVLPLPAREYPSFAEALPRTSLVQTDLVPWRPYDIHRTNVNAAGIAHSFNTQSYFFYTLTDPYPAVSLLDGPRGQGTVMMATHLQVGRNGVVYFADPWRVGKIGRDGSVTTLAGYRHKGTPRHSTTPASDVELVGDWSAVPADRRGFHEIWGAAWDTRSLLTNDAAAPIAQNGVLEKPHLTGPRFFVADSQRNRVVLLTFSPASHEVPPRVTEFLTGLKDPWDVVCVDGVLYVSERQAHRVAAYDATTGKFLRTVVSGKALASVNASRETKDLASKALIQAEQCVAPEGLYHLDGWLYYGSLPMGQIRRVHLQTGVIEVVATPQVDGNSKFFKFAVSDGTFYPRGTVFTCGWGVFSYGRPQGVNVGTNSAGYGPGRPWETLGYPTACAVGQGRLVCASSAEGIVVLSKALPTDAVIKEATWKAGVADYWNRGLQLTHGRGGFGYYGLPLPWGLSPEIDGYLQAHGHQRPA